MDIKEVAKKYESFVIEQRRHLHRHPELSGQEYETSKYLKGELDKLGLDWVPCGLETGILVTIKGAKPGKTILLRGDMDALPVTELTGVEYASENEGVMHACGHDNHMAMLLTAAAILNDMKDELCGTVKLAFQPAEETAEGARSMIEQGALEGVDSCYGSHIWADIPAGKVIVAPGPRMASADKFMIDVKGYASHGAAPHQGVDAVLVASAIVQNLQAISARQVNPMEPVVVTVGTIEGGDRWNVVSGSCHMEGTTRCFNMELNGQLEGMVRTIAENTAKAYGAEADVTWIKIVPPTINAESIAAIAQESAKKILGDDCLYNMDPTTGGEDFAYFMEKVPGMMVLQGCRNEELDCVYPNHNGHFNVDESALIQGAMLYAQVAMDHNAQ